MAARVNTRFVLILAAVLLLLVGGLLGAFYWMGRKDPSRNLARAAAFLAQGDQRRALEEYERALAKQPNNIELILKYVDLAERTDVETQRDAQLTLQRIGSFLMQATTLEPGNQVVFSRLMDFYYRVGRELGDTKIWNSMLERCQATLGQAGQAALATKYRGIAQVNRMRVLDLKPEEIDQAQVDLQKALEAAPNDTDAIYHLAQWHLIKAHITERSGTKLELVKPLREQAVALAQQLTAAAGEQAPQAMDRIRILLELGDTQTATPEINRLEARLLEKPDPVIVVLDLAALIQASDRSEVDRGPGLPKTLRGYQRAQALLEAAAKAHPQDIRVLFSLGEVLERQRMPDAAIQVLQQARQLKVQGKPFVAVQFTFQQHRCAILYAEQRLEQVSRVSDPAQRQAAFKEVQEILTEVESQLGRELPLVNRLAGKLAMAQDRWVEATNRFDRASTQMRDTNPDLLMLSAACRLQQGDVGAAVDRFRQILAMNPQAVPVRLQVAQLLLVERQLDEARQQIDLVLQAEPRNVQALQLQAQLQAQRGEVEPAIATYRKILDGGDAGVVPALAALYLSQKREADARALLTPAFEKNPKDLKLLQLLVRVTPDPAQAKALVQRSRAAGADQEALDTFELVLESPGDMAAVVEQLAARESDPLKRALQQYAVYRQLNRAPEAEKALAEAARLSPDHRAVVEAQFQRALAQRDWKQAQDLANKAASLNLDDLQGHLYLGQLAMAQNRFADAIGSFRAVVERRPVFSDGHRYLGDAYRLAGDLKEAAEAYSRAVSQRPNNLPALRGLAATLEQQKEHGRALDWLRRAIDFAPGDRLLLNQYLLYEEQYGDKQKALALRRNLARNNPDDTDNLRAMVLLLGRMKEFAEGRRVMDELLAQGGKTVVNLAVDASLRNMSGDVAGARKMLEDHVKQLGDKARADDWVLLAKFYMTIEEGDLALEAFNQAIKLEDPSKRLATRELADLLFDRALFDEALQYYKSLYDATPTDLRVAQRYAEALLRAGQTDDAERVLKRLVQDQGAPDPTAMVLEGMIARNRGAAARAAGDEAKALTCDQQALAALRKAVAMAPTRPIFHLQLGEQLARTPGKEKEALEAADKAVELDKSFIPAYLLAARVLLGQRAPDEAIRYLTQALARSPRHVTTRQLLVQTYENTNKTEPLRVLLEDAVKLFPKETTWLRLQARQALREGNTALALERLNKAVEINPNVDNVADLGAALLRAQRPQEVTALLEKHTQALGSSGYLQAVYGRALAALGQRDRVEPCFRQGLTLAKSFGELTLINDYLLQAVGPKRTLEVLAPLVAGANGTWISIATAATLVTDQQYDEALKVLGQLSLQTKERTGERNVVDRLKALCLHRTGRHEQALGIYESLLKTEPDNVPTLNNLAYLLAEGLRRPLEALKHAQRAHDLAPNDPQVLDTYGWTLFKAGRGAEGAQYLRQSIERLPLATNQYHLAVLLLETSRDRPEAVRYLESAAKMAEENREAETLAAVRKLLEGLKN